MADYTPAEQKEHRRLWVEALRSGKYQQAQGALRRGDAMCCLGVACEVSGLGRWDDEAYVYRGSKPTEGYLPNKVREWLGLDDARGGISGALSLVRLNDDRVPFLRIADIIESEPDGLIATPTDAVLP